MKMRIKFSACERFDAAGLPAVMSGRAPRRPAGRRRAKISAAPGSKRASDESGQSG